MGQILAYAPDRSVLRAHLYVRCATSGSSTGIQHPIGIIHIKLLRSWKWNCKIWNERGAFAFILHLSCFTFYRHKHNGPGRSHSFAASSFFISFLFHIIGRRHDISWYVGALEALMVVCRVSHCCCRRLFVNCKTYCLACGMRHDIKQHLQFSHNRLEQ